MTRKFFRAFVLGAVGVFCVSAAFGQNARVASAVGDKYLISAKAGGVNYTEGRVVISHSDGRNGQLLKGDEIGIGEQIATGADGRAEILLNPGSYLRIDKETEFSFVSTSLDDLKINLNSGSAIFEVIADNEFKVSVRMPKSHVDLVRSGVFRVDVLADGGAKVSVIKGTAFVGSEKTEVKAGRIATIDGGSAVVAKLDKDKNDLDIWSKDRAKELAKANAGLQRRTLRDTLMSSFNRRSGWNMYDSFGLWIFNPSRSYWCFMPFGYGWGSPYGYGYDWDLWGLGMPTWIYYQPPIRNPPTTAGNPGTKNPALLPPNNGDTHGRLRPPFTKIQENTRGGGVGIVDRKVDIPSGGSGPVFSPPTSSSKGSGPISVPVSQPAPVYTPPTIAIPRGPEKGKP